MPFSAKDMILGGLIPAVIVVAVCLLSAKFLAREQSRSIVANWAIAIAFLAGIRLLALSPWKPASHWHWLPYIGIAGAILSPLLLHTTAVTRCAAAVIAAGAAAYLLVPDWDDLPQSRTVMTTVFSAALVAVWAAIRPLTQRVEKTSLAIVLAGSVLGATLILMLAGSLRFGQIGGSLAAGFLGLTVIQLLNRKPERLPDLSFLFTVLCGGAMLVGQLNSSSDIPFACFLIPPLAPLAIWLGRIGPLQRLDGRLRVAADVLAPAVCVLTAVGIAAATQLMSGSTNS